MTKYRVYLQTVASTVIEVEAEDKNEAYEIAADQDMPRICAQCSGWGSDQNLELGDVWEGDDDIEKAVEEVKA
jgi:hypothetical protein